MLSFMKELYLQIKEDSTRVSTDDEGVTTFKALMAITDEELSIERVDARSGQWVEITMKKDEISDLKKVIEKWTSSRVTEQVPGNIVRALGGKVGIWKKNPQRKLFSPRAEPSGITKYLTISKIKQTTDNLVSVNVKQKSKTKSPPDSPTKKLLLTLMHEGYVAVEEALRHFIFKGCWADRLLRAAFVVMVFRLGVGEAVNTGCYTQNRSIIVKRHGKTAYDVFKERSIDISYFYMFGCHVHIHNHIDHLGKFDEEADDGFFLGYSLVAKSFRVFNIRRQEMEEAYHEFVSPDKQTKLSLADDLQVLNEHDNLESTDRWSREKHIELVNIIGEPLDGITTRSRVRDSEAASAHECLYINFLSETEPKRLIEALEEEGWVIAMQEELNQFKRNKVWTLVPYPMGFRQEEGIDYDETFAPVARLEAIKVFLAYAAYMSFMVYQMDVKSAFLNGKISEEVYVQQPPGLKAVNFPTITSLSKYELADSASVKCLMLPPNNLGPNESGVSVNEILFRGMIGSLMYLTASKPDIQFSTCLCARYQANPKESHLVAVKRIFRYLKGTPNLGLWYPKGSGFDLKAYLDLDYDRCNLDRKSTSGGCQILGGKLVCWSAKKQSSVVMSSAEAEYVAAARCSEVVDDTITYSLSNIEKPLSFNRDIFSSVIGLDYTKDFVSLPPHEAVKDALATLGLADDKRLTMTSVALAHSSPLRIRYFSPT
ncbi:retrovirus-related pol polyprotein from transposon TNT 1-94 [Tanacetum coccineum]